MLLEKINLWQSGAIDLLRIRIQSNNGAKYLNKIITECDVGDARYPWIEASDNDKTQIENGLKQWCNSYASSVRCCCVNY